MSEQKSPLREAVEKLRPEIVHLLHRLGPFDALITAENKRAWWAYERTLKVFDAILAAHPDAPEPVTPPTCEQHHFDDYVVCRRCGQTESAAFDDCHHARLEPSEQR